MEYDPLSQANFDQPVLAISSTREDDQQRGYQARSYECIFCKRGFSNAQALGGHMNIHRKEKAKLKQSSSSNYTPNIIQQPIWGFINSSEMDHNIIASKKWPWIFSDPDTHHHHQYHATSTVKDHETPTTHSGQLQQLPLFSETGNENRQSGGKGFSSSSSSSSSSRLEQVMGEDDLDLELRLGHQPGQDQSAEAAATGMKKFL